VVAALGAEGESAPLWWPGALALAPDESADLIPWPGALALAPEEPADPV
jgi:hypothetical protein